MTEKIHVVIGGPAYGHADPKKAFESKLDAKDYEASLDGFDWTAIRKVEFEESSLP